MILLAQIIGLLAVVTFLLSYQNKTRENIIKWNVISRILYIIQYVLLGAFEGAVLDIVGAISSIVANKKENKVIKVNLPLVILNFNLLILVVGMVMYKNIFSLFPIIGVMLHTSAFWISDEKKIRIISFLGSPFWLVYNLSKFAYGSALGDILTMLSIGLAIYRYDFKKNESLE